MITNSFDPELAIAELEGQIVIIQHHLRRIAIERNDVVAREFYRKLGEIEHKARMVCKEVDKNRLQNKYK
jgi:hypothetical protein